MCTDCLRPHPVGIRCKECVGALRLPTYQISATYYVKGFAGAFVSGFIALAVLTSLLSALPMVGFFFFILMGGVGYILGEVIGFAVNQRRGRPYQYMAVTSVLLATVPLVLPSFFSLAIDSLLDILGVGIAAIVAWNRRGV